MNSYSIDYSANQIVNTISNATTTNVKWDQTDGKDHPDYSIPYDEQYLYGNSINYIQNEGIVIASDAVFIKPLKLVVLTEDVYNKLREKDND